MTSELRLPSGTAESGARRRNTDPRQTGTEAGGTEKRNRGGFCHRTSARAYIRPGNNHSDKLEPYKVALRQTNRRLVAPISFAVASVGISDLKECCNLYFECREFPGRAGRLLTVASPAVVFDNGADIDEIVVSNIEFFGTLLLCWDAMAGCCKARAAP